MVSKPARPRRPHGGDTLLTGTTPSPLPDPEREWAWKLGMRAAAFTRHLQACPACSAPDGLFADGTPCAEGMRLAAAADEAQAHCEKSAEAEIWARTAARTNGR